MSRKIIADSFDLGGHTINTVYKSDLIMEHGATGQAKFMHCLVEVQDIVDGVKMAKSYQEQTFVHELVHMILYIMSHDLCVDEKFVDNFSQHLYQYLKTAKYK